MKKIVIVGGGSCGLSCAIRLSQLFLYDPSIEILLLEQKEKIGKKLLATGNGRCNLSNKDQSMEYYQGHHVELLQDEIQNFDCPAFFESIGLWTKYLGSLLYPQSEQALSVVERMETYLKEHHCKIFVNEKVQNLTYDPLKKQWNIETNNQHFLSDYVVMACGGKAASHFGSDGSGYDLLKKLGFKIYPTYPSLVQLKTEKKHPELKGVRIHGTFTLYNNDQIIKQETGEILFTDVGLSGISILQLSRYYSKLKGKIEVGIDSLDEYSPKELAQKIADQLSLELFDLDGLVSKKYAQYLKRKLPQKIAYKEIRKVVQLLKDHRFTIIGTRDFKDAQVTQGGVALDQLDLATLEAMKYPNLYVGGELLDVDGACGGYNLHFAFTCANMIAKAIYEKETGGKEC